MRKVLILFITSIIIYSCGNNQEVNKVAEEEIPEPTLIYNIAIDSFDIETGLVPRNKPLALLLNDYGINYDIINKISLASDSVFDLRYFKAGNKYTCILSKDTLKCLKYFVYEHSLVDYLVIDLNDTVFLYTGKKPVRTEIKTFCDTIRTSLWLAMEAQNTNPLLSIELSEIYAWTVDSFMLDGKDHITVKYDEEFVDTNSIGISKIHYARFIHRGETYYAIPFNQDSTISYFDSDGSSLKRQFLKAPLSFTRVSSGFTYRRKHPVLGIYRPHTGVDYAAPTGTPVFSVGDGTIIQKGYSKASGYYVKIRHNSVYSTAYCHFNSFARGLKRGGRVRQGEVIGYVGSTGYATGPHLDFRFWKNGKAIDPLRVKAPPVEPIKDVNKEAFDSVKIIITNKIDSICMNTSEKPDSTNKI
jgi:hypothetical protein